jgi:hypothetical protein
MGDSHELTFMQAILDIMCRPEKWPALTLPLKRGTQTGILAHYKGFFTFVLEKRPGVPDFKCCRDGLADLPESLVKEGWVIE